MAETTKRRTHNNVKSLLKLNGESGEIVKTVVARTCRKDLTAIHTMNRDCRIISATSNGSNGLLWSGFSSSPPLVSLIIAEVFY